MVYILENTDSLTEDFLEKANSLLSLQRLQKNDTLRITSDKINSAAVYLLLRYGLKMEYDISEPPVFETGSNGKPYLRDNKEIFFNLSHCRNSCACIISDSETAIDIADCRRISDNTAKYFCTPEQLIAAHKSDDKARALVRLWAIKECHSKISGAGLGMDFRKITEEEMNRITVIENERYYTAYYSRKPMKVKKVMLSNLLDIAQL